MTTPLPTGTTHITPAVAPAPADDVESAAAAALAAADTGPVTTNNTLSTGGPPERNMTISTWGSSQGSPNLTPDLSASNAYGLSEGFYRGLVSFIWMCIGAIFGALCRILLAQLFGEECKNPQTVGWLKAGGALCVTAQGEGDVQGGIIFADLPANLLGCFIMGLFQSSLTLGLPVTAPIAFVNPTSSFQRWDVMHLAIRTGFCGSLTTFSSWNSEMVIMMFGTNYWPDASAAARSFFGYLVGMETALGSFVLGKKVAVWIHRWKNPSNAKEMDALHERTEQGVHINRDLPEFERRYLPDLRMEMKVTMQDAERIRILSRWRQTTYNARRVGHKFLPLLIEIENAVLVRGEKIPHRADSAARNLGWDCDALMEWALGMPYQEPKVVEPQNSATLVQLESSFLILGLLIAGLVMGVIFIDGVSSYAVTYRQTLFVVLFAPFGAVLRWQLGRLNGCFTGGLAWLPFGTLFANLLGSIVSIAMVCLELVMPWDGFWQVAALRATKVGFAGSLTTVSTFVAETNGFMNHPRTQDLAYKYMTTTLFTACVLASFTYVGILYGVENY